MEPGIRKRPWSDYVLGLWLLVFFYFLLYQEVWRQTGMKAIISWDAFGYYLYLPATFIYHDLFHLHFISALFHKYNPSSYFYAASVLPDGNYYMSYTMGLSILYFPFFLLGHLMAILGNYRADGLSLPYQLAIYLGGVFYSFMGLFMIRKVLRRFFDEKVVAAAIFLLIFGTNYFHYSMLENGMQHVYQFFLYAVVLWLTIRWHESHLLKHMVALGFTIGLMTLMRPTEIIAILIPALWNVTSLTLAREKVKLFFHYRKQIIVGACCLGLMAVPQMIYWKMATSHFIFYSYGNIGFDFGHPHILPGLFGFRKGWFVFTPLMIFAMLGFIPLYRYYRPYFWPVFLYLLINIYLVFSWSVWWYGGGFGARAVVESYAVLLLPLGAWMRLTKRKARYSIVFSLVACACIFLNLFQDWQLRSGLYSTEGMSPYVYKLLFLKTKVDHNMLIGYDDPEQVTPEALNAQKNYSYRPYYPDSIYRPYSGPIEKGKNDWKLDSAAFYLDHGQVYVPIKVPMSALQTKPGDSSWIKVTIAAKFDNYEWEHYKMATLAVKIITPGNQVVKEAHLQIQHLIHNATICNDKGLFGEAGYWDWVSLVLKPPKETVGDSVIVSITNPGKNRVYINYPQIGIIEPPNSNGSP